MSNGIIEITARAIITDDTKTKMLFCAPQKENSADKYYYLPGGHVEFGESAKAALLRELSEETGIRASTAELNFIGTEENIFMQGNIPHHEINVYFEVKRFFSGREKVESLEKGILFEWLPIADIPNFPILPEKIKSFLSKWETGKLFWNFLNK
jgi:ADP-ribose pyrophosphatase YjhB (NUDIX family)